MNQPAATQSETKKMSAAKKALIAFGVIVVLVAIGSKKKDNATATATDARPTAAQTEPTTAAEPEKPKPTEAAPVAPPTTYKIGDTVELDDSTWVVLEAKDRGKKLKSNNMFQKDVTTEGKYVAVHFKVTNKTPKPERVMRSPSLFDAQGRQFERLDAQAFFVPKGAKTMALEPLPSSMAREFWSVFEMPADATGLKFEARALSAFGDGKRVELGL